MNNSKKQPKMIAGLHRQVGIFFTAIFMILVTGCVNYQANYHKPRYGIAASDKESAESEGIIVSIPETAPSISQGFDPPPTEKSPGDFESVHAGIDIVGVRGTPILAAADGTVVRSGYDPMYGNVVSIVHSRKYRGETIKTNYYHLQEREVTKGQKVSMGQPIGALGSAGLLAAFLHLHFETRSMGDGIWIPLNPHLFWVDGIGQVTCYSDTARQKSEVIDQFLMTYPAQCR